MSLYISIILAGFFGGVVRGLVGFLKHRFSYKDVPFKMTSFLGTVFISGIIGLTTAMALKEVGFNLDGFYSPALSFIVGYAGGDFIQNIYKIITKKSSLFNG